MTKHPAKFSKELLPLLAELVGDRRPVLDPMAGTGKITDVIPHIWLNELEPEWAAECRSRAQAMTGYTAVVTVGDARSLPYPDGSFAAVVTSPTYANRMADHHEARDLCKSCNGAGATYGGLETPTVPCKPCNGKGLSRRNTYTHTLGRKLTTGNTGAMQWGTEYREVHTEIWEEVFRVLAPGGRFVLNVKDHIRKGELVPVSSWHRSMCQIIGFHYAERYMVACPGQRQGSNGDLRVPYENVYVMEKPSSGNV